MYKNCRKKIAALILLLIISTVMSVTAVAAPRGSAPEKALAVGSTDGFIEEKSLQPAVEQSYTWVKSGSRVRLRDANGKYKKGFVTYRGCWYYFDSNGNLKVGFFTVGGRKWFASYVRGAAGKGQILTGLVRIGKYNYFLDPSSSPCPGAMRTGFCRINGRRYYFDKDGHMVKGWFTVQGSRYYASCNPKGHPGALLTGKQKIGNRYYYLNPDGKLIRNIEPGDPGVPDVYTLKPICQYPALPTGCEMTSLAMVLDFMGVKADKCDLADKYLDKGPVGKVNFWKAFVGNPRNARSYGCYAPVVVNTANRYLRAKNSSMRATYYAGKTLEFLTGYTRAGYPVIVWCTIDCRQARDTATWVVNGEKIRWRSPHHCVVFLGIKNGKAVIADPTYGRIKLYDKELFRRGYTALYEQAVIIR